MRERIWDFELFSRPLTFGDTVYINPRCVSVLEIDNDDSMYILTILFLVQMIEERVNKTCDRVRLYVLVCCTILMSS